VTAERYVTADELAAHMAVSVRTIKRWTGEGMPSETWGMRTRRYLPSLAIEWARDRGAHGTFNGDNDRRPLRLTIATAPHREE
jgi:phage terminase Nu1 subunit (DNA packaging protein)